MTTPEDFPTHLARRRAEWAERGLTRHTCAFGSAQDPVALVDGESRQLFSSSNYLGLATDRRLISDATKALQRYGVGSGGSRLTTGTTLDHDALEREIADWLGYPRSVFFATGFQANIGVLSVLADAGTTIFSDAKNHASLIDGCRYAKALHGTRTIVYPHCDLEALRELLREHRESDPTGRILVVSDGVFSMDGTVAPVAELVRLAREFGGWTLIDDAHGVGTLGEQGRGVIDLASPADAPEVLVMTASKALGCEGGAVCCDEDVAELLRNQARSFVFSTAPAPATVAAVRAAVRVVSTTSGRVGRVQRRAQQLREGLAQRNLIPQALADAPPSPIVPVVIGAEEDAMDVAERLRARGYHIPAIRYPTVPEGQAILRITVMATHTPEQIEELLDNLEELVGLVR